MTDTIITVQGEFEIRHPAELGTVTLTISFDGSKREDVVAKANRELDSISTQLRDLEDTTNGPVTWRAVDQLRVWGSRPFSPEGKQLAMVHHAQVDVAARFRDLNWLADWVGAVSLVSGVTVNGIEWSLTDAKRQTLTQEARRRAVENAVAKATVYATSLGLSTVRPLALSDPGMLGDSAGAVQPAPMLMSSRVSGDHHEGGPALRPDDITIRIQVHARFAAS
jgi:uncharacterized protein